LVQPSVRPDPLILLGDSHLQNGVYGISQNIEMKPEYTVAKFMHSSYRCQEARSRSLVNTQQQSDEGDEVVLDEGLVQERVQHAR